MSPDSRPSASSGKGHVWLHVERKFRRIKWLRSVGFGNSSRAISLLVKSLYPVILVATRSLLYRGSRRNWQDEASDVSQRWWQIMLNGGFDRCKPGTPICCYAYKVLQHLCADVGRRARRERFIPPGYDPSDDRFNPKQRHDETERLESVRDKCDDLPENQRRAVRAKYWDDVPGNKAAEEAGISRNALFLRRFHGLKELREWLGDALD